MCEDEGTGDGDGTADAPRFSIGGKGRGEFCQWLRLGGQWMMKCGEAMREMMWRALLSMGGS